MGEESCWMYMRDVSAVMVHGDDNAGCEDDRGWGIGSGESVVGRSG
jgi:hypothetical protein